MESLFITLQSILSSVRPIDILDILIVAFAIYKSIRFIHQTRAQQLVNGLLILVAAMIIADVLNLYTVHFIIYNGMRYGVMAIIVIFYPELRRALEYLGRGKFIFTRTRLTEKDISKRIIREMLSAIDFFSANHVGALIVIERDVALGDIFDHGTIVDADTSEMLLKTIFYEGTSLHDGAVIMREGRIYAAGCVLPLSQNKNLESTLGTRHRAGLGITEASDAVSIIVSEETGIISIASEGRLSRFLDLKSVEKMLYDVFVDDIEDTRPTDIIFNLFRRKKNG